MVRCLTIFAIAILSSGCCTVPPHVSFETPDRPTFSEYTEDEWHDLPESIQRKITDDDLAMKDYIIKVEHFAEVHNRED